MTDQEARPFQCARCGRTPAEVPGPWIMNTEDGVVVSYLCPDDQTADEDLEANVNEASDPVEDGLLHENDPSVLALSQQLNVIVDGVFAEWLDEVRQSPETRGFDPYGLADKALEVLVPMLGGSTDDVQEKWRDQLAAIFLDLAHDELHRDDE